MNPYELPEGGSLFDRQGGIGEASIMHTAIDVTYELKHRSSEELFLTLVPELVELAVEAAKFTADSYRQFHVAAAALAIDEKTGRAMIIIGANFKGEKDDSNEFSPKSCAEHDILHQAEELGMTHIVGFVTYADIEPEEIVDVLKREEPTLCPCGVCDTVLAQHPLVDEATILISTAPDKSVIQSQTIRRVSSPAVEKIQTTVEYNDDSDAWARAARSHQSEVDLDEGLEWWGLPVPTSVEAGRRLLGAVNSTGRVLER
jgi:cytidine deaminase